ncbi:Nicotinamide/nicotinic acid mononucleotide adenylyltransferase 1 [Metarhizium acridum]|uniref:Nicotinamide/nicotinic acid mononucleotide adenylyltransferase 1 n=1 Tax=Metarhizium acridum TaxID=92637 RepID=UPI001C6A8F84|nr:Nicotinamide/nicotinic acid mononucleotide adenylyltransferase 1 [Metarhizium acridum]
MKAMGENIQVIRQVVSNDISSTKVRLLLRRSMSIDYLIPDDVVNYMHEHNLYRELDLAKPSKGKEQATAGTSTS